jgi:hypothetical protein
MEQAKMSDQPKTALPANPELSRQLVGEIAMDIGKEVAAHIETMYPKAVEAARSTFLLSVRNCVYNEIIADLELSTRRRSAADWKPGSGLGENTERAIERSAAKRSQRTS